jgi:hypothetical protein
MRSADLETSSSIPGRRGAAISSMDLKKKVETVGVLLGISWSGGSESEGFFGRIRVFRPVKGQKSEKHWHFSTIGLLSGLGGVGQIV